MIFTILAMTGLTILCYVGGKWLYSRFPYPFLLPLVTSTVLLLMVLYVADIQYNDYLDGAGWLESLIGIAVVALAYPLYKQLPILKKYSLPLLVGTAVGSIVGVISTLILSSLFGFNEEIIVSLLPKSVTTAVALDLAEAFGGQTSLTAILVTVAGITGTVLYPYCCKLFRIHHVVGRGVGVGSASHAIGTAKALEYSELEGAISTVAMTLCALMVSVIIPISIFLWF
ncbi:LrgB family protein [Alkalicoccobacillus murimartini]|uniref:Murein hydrolase (TIGR00659 family) n=1 Tax=Alkalicoccobacillus murimartini TaxID=171685 RepID=A0ABT9YJY5_9BACI|nr:LrgB family protein [Alkalicoccobacillus murimartini]MDQ0208175.1 putative murein hydrolase (TIGR00659 family) [Alkalicoccobacillus murimartini]